MWNGTWVGTPTRSICPGCGTRGTGVTPGSLWVELALWCFFLLPGVFYSLWRLSNRNSACPACGGRMIPVHTPRGRELAGHHERRAEQDERSAEQARAKFEQMRAKLQESAVVQED